MLHILTFFIALFIFISLEAFFPAKTIKMLSWIALREKALIKKISDEIKQHV